MRRELSRRAVLRGTGAAVALPFLEAMMPRTLLAAPAAKTAIRMAFIFFPNGANMEHWRQPKTPGLPDTLAPLKPVSTHLLHITGLQQKNGEGLGDGAGDHARDSAVYLTGNHPKKTDGKDIHAGVSADQFAAQQIGGETPLPSLELGTQEGAQSGNCDSGYSCAYSSNISWRTPSSPMAKEINPRSLFIRMFGDPKAKQSEAEIAREATYTRSILDMVMEDSKRLKARIGASDQAKLDEYLEGVRGIEKQIQNVEKRAALPAPTMELPNGVPQDHGEHLRLMYDLLAAAFQTDTTRIATFMVANSGSNRTFPSIGISEGHHTLSHHAGAKDKLDKIRKIDTFYVEQFAHFLQKLNSMKEDGKTVLDNSMILYGGAISDGNRHNHDDLPILLAGKGGGTIASGRFIKHAGKPLCDLYLAMFARMKVKATTFGDGKAPLPI
jgi:hypothetical protein